jgi:colanic acid/amylovoran biosynthesis glycosyltransferase
MSVLFMMPNWQAPSEVFLQRMLAELRADLGCVVAINTQGEKFWQKDIPAVSLAQPDNLARRALQRFGLPVSSRPAQEVLRAACRRKGISRVLCHYAEFACQYMPVWNSTELPLFVHLHGYDVTVDLRRHENPGVRVYDDAYVERLQCLTERATLIANSAFTKNLLVDQGLPAEKIIIKYLGVPLPEKIKVHRGTCSLKILHVGRLIDVKSPDRTIAAFDYASLRGLDAALLLVGDGPLRATCELARARSPFRERIQLLGAVDAASVQRLLGEADIYTQHNVKGELSHQEESFGVSIVEAMSAGLPVVGTRSGGVPETVVDKLTGILVEPGDVAGQGEALLKLARDVCLRQVMGDAGRQRVAALFSLEGEQRQLRDILQLKGDG